MSFCTYGEGIASIIDQVLVSKFEEPGLISRYTMFLILLISSKLIVKYFCFDFIGMIKHIV